MESKWHGTFYKFQRMPGSIESDKMLVTLIPILSEKGMTLERISIGIKNTLSKKHLMVYIRDILKIFI